MERWTEQERRALLDGVGAFGWSALRRRTGARSKKAIQSKLQRNFGGGGITRGTYSVDQAEEETGYHRTQLKRAAKALSQRWTRTARGGNFLISAEQLEDIVSWLRHDYWCLRLELYGCVRCGTSDQPHYSFGCCLRCYKRLRWVASKNDIPFSRSGLLVYLQVARDKRSSHFLDMMIARVEVGKAPLKEDLQKLKKLVG